MAGGRIDIEIGADLSGFEGQVREGMEGAGGAVDGLAGKLAGLAAAAGVGLSFASVIETGNEFQRTLNSLSGVTSATAAEMTNLKAKAMELGNDTDLSATSANDAAAAMLELSKGGFSVDQSMQAAKGTLQLAAAAQIDAAQAATIQSQALQAFGLQADYASTASDVLANAANASSAEITDIAAGLQQSGAVANQFGVSIEDTAATLGVLADAGITGSDAGTLLRSTLLSLTDTSKPAVGAMETLGLTAYDAQGQFVGMASLFGQLQRASQELTPEMYQQATATLLGSDAMRLGGVAAEQGAAGFQSMRAAVEQQGAAAQLAAAQNQGLPGVFERLENTSERLQLQLYDLIDGPLTAFGTTVLDLADGALDRFDSVVAAAQGDMTGLGGSVSQAASNFPMLSAAWGNLVTSGESLGSMAVEAGNGLLDLGRGALVSGGLLDTVQAAGQGAAAALDGTLNVIEPLVSMVSSLAGVFGSLPGPIQTAVTALVALRVAQSVFASQIATARSNITTYASAVRGFATATGAVVQTTRVGAVSVGRFGTAIANIGQRAPGIAAVQSSFVNAASSAALAGQSFARTTGAVAATGTAMRVAAGGLASALGGPVGIAITAAVAGLSLYAKSQRDAAQAAAEHRASVQNLVTTLDPQTGAITQATVAAQAKINADNGMAQSANNYGIASGTLVGAQLRVRSSLDDVNSVLDDNVRKSVEATNAYQGYGSKLGLTSTQIAGALRGNQADIDAYYTAINRLTVTGEEGFPSLEKFRKQLDQSGQGALDLGASVGSANDALSEAERIQKDVANAMDRGGRTAETMSGALDTLSNSASTADQRVTAVKDALDALNGNALSTEEAQSRLNESFDRTAEALVGTDEAKPGFDQLTGAIDTTTEAGRNLLDSLSSQRETMIGAAQAASDAAGKNGDLAAAQGAARSVIDSARQSLVDQALQLGYTSEAAQALADRYLGIPGEVATLISTPGSFEAQAAMDILKGKVDLVPDDKAITVETLDQEAITRLEALGFKVTTLPNGQVKVEALTDPARTAIDNLVNTPRTVQVGVQYTVRNPEAVTNANQFVAVPGGGRYAEGGEVPANMGTPGVDSVPAMLMPNEHVLDTTDVALMGGQAGVYRFREALNAGKIRGFADGGAVDGLDNMVNFARSNAGRGYVWGDWDCSMFMSQIAAAGMGRPLGRLWTTYSILGGDLAGMQPGGNAGHFRIGVSDEHMAGTLFLKDGSRVDVENGGSNSGSTFGAGAAGYDDPQFPSQFHLPDSALNPALLATAGSFTSSTPPVVDEKTRLAIDSANVAVQQAKESRDKVKAQFDEGKKTQADVDQANIKVQQAEQKVRDLEAKTATTTAGPAPQAPEVGSFTDDEIAKMRAQIAVDEANTRRNTVYADPASTENDKREADIALIEARNRQKEAGETSTATGGVSNGESGGGSFSLKDRLKRFGSDISGIFVDALFEQLPYGIGESRWLTTDFTPLTQIGTYKSEGASEEKPAAPPSSFSEAEINGQLPVTPGAPNWVENLQRTAEQNSTADSNPLQSWLNDADQQWKDQFTRAFGVPLLRDTGGPVPHGRTALNLSGETEWMLTGSERADYARDVAMMRASKDAGSSAQSLDLSGIDARIGELVSAARQPQVVFQTDSVAQGIRDMRSEQNVQALTFRRR